MFPFSSSGHLRLTNYGTAINLFDVVMRTNQAPIKVRPLDICDNINEAIFLYCCLFQDYAKYIGSKTTFRLINRSISKMYMRSMGHGRMRGPKSQPKPEPPAQRRLLQKEGENEGETIITIGGSKLPLEHNVTMALITETRSRPADVKKFYNVIHPMRPDVRILALSGQARRAAEALLVSWNKQQKVSFFCSYDTSR